MSLNRFSLVTTFLALAITTTPALAKSNNTTDTNLQARSNVDLVAQYGGGMGGGGMHGGMHGGDHDHMMAELNLTDEQKQQMQAIRQKYQPQIEPLRQNMRTLQQELHQMMAGSASDDDLKSKHDQLMSLKNQMGNLHFQSMLEMRQILTPEQRQEMGQMMEQRRQQHGNPGQGNDLDD